MLSCYNCFAEVTEVSQARSKAVLTAAIDRFGSEFVERMTDFSTVETVHIRASGNQMDADQDVVYCPDCTVTLIYDGLDLEAVVPS